MATSGYSNGQLTRHGVGTMGEMWAMSWPLMLMAFSTYAMIFADRLIVARYSVDAMSAVSIVCAAYSIFQFSFLTLALIAEVFVGQYNGSGQEGKVGKPVWQMVWMSLMSSIILIPVGLYCGEYVISARYIEHGGPYFTWMMGFAMFSSMAGAFSAFFVGRGKTRVVTTVIAVCNATNIVLDYLFVFGWEGLVPSMGTMGAALATGISLVLQCMILMTIFLSSKNRERYGTGDCRFDSKLFMNCLRVGGPNALSMAVGVGAWAMLFRIVGETGAIYIAALAITQHYYFVICIITEGIGKAVIAICSNLIGAGRRDEVATVVSSAKRLLWVFIMIFLVPFVIYPLHTIGIFAGEMMDVPGFYGVARMGMLTMWLAMILFGRYWIYLSQLTSAGDTKFIMYANMLITWTFLVLPTYILVVVLGYRTDVIWAIMVGMNILAMLLFRHRVRSEKWKRLEII